MPVAELRAEPAEDAATRRTPAGGAPPAAAAAGPAGAVAALQRAAGNAAVTRMLAARQGPPRGSGPAAHPALRGQVATAPAPAPAAAEPVAEPAEESVDVPGEEPLVESTMEGGGEGGGGGAGEEGGSGGPPPELPPEQQAQLIAADSEQSEQQVNAIATNRRSEISGQFGGVRRRVTALLGSASAGVQGFLSARQAEVQAAATAVFTTGQNLMTSTMQAARGLLTQARTTLDGIVAAATAGLESQVNAAAGRITGLVDGISLPDLPGVSAIRSGARALAGRAAGVVTSGLGLARGLISSAVQQGTRLLSSALSAAEQAASSALGRVRTMVTSAVRSVFAGLSRIGSSVLNALRTALNAGLMPGLNRAESTITGQVSTAQRQAVRSIRSNRDQHLQGVREGRRAADGGDLVSQARQNNASVVNAFRERTGSILGSVFGALATGASAVVAHIGRFVGRVIDLVRAPLVQMVAQLRQLGQAIASFFSALLADLGEKVTAVVGFVRSAVQEPLDAVIRFASGAVTRIGQFFSGLASRLLSGNFSLPGASELVGDPRASGPIVKPPPGPIVKPALELLVLIFAVVGAIVLYFAPQLAAVAVAILALIGVEATVIAIAVVIGLLAVLALALLLLMLYLLYKLVKPGPKPPPPTITHATDFAAPDGSPNTRNLVGVGERVVFTGSAPGTWTASAGSPRRGAGATFTWTAPVRRASVTIRLTVGRGTASERLSVLEPKSIRAIKLRELAFPPGTSGAGMKLDFEFNPLTVSFGNAETREVAGPASAITGYYKRFPKKKLAHNPGPLRFFRIAQNNRFAGAEDKASQGPMPPPFSAGSFHWKIPNKYRVITESGDGKQYTVVKQEFGMEASGKASVDKAGAHVDRTP